MARLYTDKIRWKPWRACVTVNYQEWYLGSFRTQEEAETVENNLRRKLGRRTLHRATQPTTPTGGNTNG